MQRDDFMKLKLKFAQTDVAGKIAIYTETPGLSLSLIHISVKAYANEKGISVIGDAPIFVSYDSADVWAHQKLFRLDSKGFPTCVTGVPPDYFSETGQLWGNPHSVSYTHLDVYKRQVKYFVKSIEIKAPSPSMVQSTPAMRCV